MKLGIASRLLPAVILISAAALGQSYKTSPASAPADLPPELRAQLQPQGAQVADAQGNVICQVWLRKDIPSAPSGSSSDAIYPGLSVGTLLGVVQYPKSGTDFRGQALKPGLYTLRYAHIPTDGNHLGVNPYPDFALLSPVTADSHNGEVVKLEDLLKLSRQASGTAHPAILSLVPAAQGAALPSIASDDQGRQALELKLPTQGGGTAFAMIVVGQTTGQ